MKYKKSFIAVLFCLGIYIFSTNIYNSYIWDFRINETLRNDDKIVEQPFNSTNFKNLETSAVLTPKNAYAIIIGISDYPGIDNDLSYCDDDAQDVYDMLIDDYNFKPENIIYLQDSNATKATINSAFDYINTQITSNDIFFFYYSGHGGASVENDGVYMHSIDSPHPYPNYYDNTWNIYHPNAAYIKVYFDHFETEYDYDWVYLGDTDLADGWIYEGYSGYSTGFWSGWIPLLSDNRLYIRFISDYSITDWGFSIDRYEVMTYDGTHYLCSYDSIPSTPSNYYLDTLINAKLDALNAAESYIITDSCHSGGIIPEVQDVGRYIMTACNDEEFSLEDHSLQHGVFTNYFLDSINLATDSNGDGVRSMEECYSYTYSNTVSYSGSLGYTHHPQQYDGISGEAVLSTAFGSVSLVPTGNSLSYSFNMYGTGLIEELKIVVCNNSQGMNYTISDLTFTPSSNTGFGSYSGNLQLDGFSGLTGYGIYAKINGNRVIVLNETNSEDTDSDSLDDAFELMMGLDPEMNDTDNDGLSDSFEYNSNLNPVSNDTDNDGLSDGDELLIYLTDAADQDTDDDSVSDGDEVLIYTTDPLDQDTEDDGMDDGYEIFNDLDPLVDDTTLDYDSDGLNNLDEFLIGTSANNNDTDSDSLPDGYEVYYGLDPLINDSSGDNDLDGVSNLIEFQLGSLPNNTDSDGDLMPDGWEYFNNLNLTNDDSLNDADSDALVNLDEFYYLSDPQDNDTDNDGLFDGEEVHSLNTDPTLEDTDADQLTDYEEVIIYLTNATNSDTESDGIEDGYEIFNDLDPLINDAGLDYDSDTLTNLLEFQIGSYANDSDSDDDLMPDGYEYNHGLNLLQDDTDLDEDNDGLSNLLECQLGCHADDPDSDGDSMLDGWEYTYGLEIMLNDAAMDEDYDGLNNLGEFNLHTDPTDTDTDDDGLSDGSEVHTYNTDPTNSDTDGDGYSDGLEVTWGSDPLNPRISLITVFLNIGGVIVLAFSSSYVVYTQVIKRKHKKDGAKIKEKFPISMTQENFNVLTVKKTQKPKPRVPSYGYRPQYTQPIPRYTKPSRISLPIGIDDLKKVRDIILSGMPPPRNSYSEEGKKAILIANMAFDSINKGDFKGGYDLMMSALILGVPEPMNSRIKKLLLDSLDRGIGEYSSRTQIQPTSKKICNWCGQINNITHKFCIKCGRLI